MGRIAELEGKQKMENDQVKQEMVDLKDQLQLFDAAIVAKSMLYSRQRIYNYGNKLGAQLARLLKQTEGRLRVPKMKRPAGEQVVYMEDKLKLFHEIFFSVIHINTGG